MNHFLAMHATDWICDNAKPTQRKLPPLPFSLVFPVGRLGIFIGDMREPQFKLYEDTEYADWFFNRLKTQNKNNEN